LEEEVTYLRRINQRKVRRINILDWLKENATPLTHFSKWTNQIDINVKYLNYMMENGLLKGIEYIIREIIPYENITNMPIRTFKHKPSRVYIYEEDKSGDEPKAVWIEKHLNEAIQLVRVIERKICGAFIKWKRENIERIENDDDFRDKVNKQQHDILGGDKDGKKSDDMLIKYIYKYLEMTYKETVEHEFI